MTLNQTTYSACHRHTKLYRVIIFALKSKCQAGICVSRLGIYNYCPWFYSIFACFFFPPKKWIVPVMMQRCSLLRNENAEDLRHSWLENSNHRMHELERRGGGEEIFQLLSIDSIFECTERSLVIYPLQHRIWLMAILYSPDILSQLKWHLPEYQQIWGIFFLHEYAALVYEGRWPQTGST